MNLSSPTPWRTTASLLAALALPATVAPGQDPPKAKPVEETPAPPKAKPVGESPQPQPEIRRPTPTPKTNPEPDSPEKDLYEYAYMLYKRESNDLAIQQFGKYVEAYPRGRHLDAVLTLKGECHLRIKQVDEAIACYNEVLRRFKSGQFLAYSASRIATLRFNEGKRLEAAPLFELAARNASKSEDRIQWYYYGGLGYKYAEKLKEANTLFEAAAKTHGTTSNIFQEKALLEVARYAMGNGRKTEAFDKFDKLAKDGSTPAVRAEAGVTAGMILLDSGKAKESVPYFDAAAQLRDTEQWGTLARYGLIRAHCAQEEWRKATDAVHGLELKYLQAETQPDVLLLIGNAYRVQENYARAIDWYGLLDSTFPESKQNAEGTYRKLVCLYKLKDPRTDAAAAAYIEKQKQRDPASEYIDMALLMKAEDNFAKKQWKPAAEAYGDVRAEKIPENLRAGMFYRRGWAEAQSGQHTLAVESLSQFILQNPNDNFVPAAMLRRAQSFLELKDLVNAIKEYDALVERFPATKECEVAYLQSGLLRGQNKDYAAMVDRLNQMLQKFPNTKYKGECLFWIGTGKFGMKQWKECLEPLYEARSLYREQFEDTSIKIISALTQLEDTDTLAQEVDAYMRTGPKMRLDASILGFLGQKRYIEKDYPSAAKYLGFAVLAPNAASLKPVVWFQLAESQLTAGDYAGAVASIDKFFAAAGELPPDRQAKSHLIRGKAHLALKKYPEARSDADNGLKLHTQDLNEPKLYLLRGDIADAQVNDGEAAQNYVLVTQLASNEMAVEAYRKLIRIYQKSGEAEKADLFRKQFHERFAREAEAFEKEPTGGTAKQ
ncbi:MAG: tetratricopeptide repeat protein [Verrucomicrobiales bacterium]|nr:tetratricopeptide repeat protein [Verrucomicrobiales bacterium]